MEINRNEEMKSLPVMPEDQLLVIRNERLREVVKVTAQGEVEINPKATIDELREAIKYMAAELGRRTTGL